MFSVWNPLRLDLSIAAYRSLLRYHPLRFYVAAHSTLPWSFLLLIPLLHFLQNTSHYLNQLMSFYYFLAPPLELSVLELSSFSN